MLFRHRWGCNDPIWGVLAYITLLFQAACEGQLTVGQYTARHDASRAGDAMPMDIDQAADSVRSRDQRVARDGQAATEDHFVGQRVDDPTIPPRPIPQPNSRNVAEIIAAHPQGGVLFLPNGRYLLGRLSGFAPDKPLVVVAEDKHQVIVDREDDAPLGQTSLVLEDVRDLSFVGLKFWRVTVRLDQAENVNFWYTHHSVPPEEHPQATKKLCGTGRSPDGFLLSNSRGVRIFGSDIDRIAHDAIKVGSTDGLSVVGTAIQNVTHGNYQTDTRVADAATCGHIRQSDRDRCGATPLAACQLPAADKLHHADGIQIFPGNVNYLTLSDSLVDAPLMWQISNGGGSSTQLQIQRTLLKARFYAGCTTVNSRIKADARAGATMDINVLQSTNYCMVDASPAPRWTFFTKGNARCPEHRIYTDAVEFLSMAQSETPASPVAAWRALHPYAAWPCFLSRDVGWSTYESSCHRDYARFTRLPTDQAAPLADHACNGVY